MIQKLAWILVGKSSSSTHYSQMKKHLLLPVLAVLLSGNIVVAGSWFGSGPWANATYYPGNLDGKYQAAVSGANTAGVLGFAIRDGSVPFLQIERESTGDALVTDAVVVNQELEIDRTVNYYAIFVNGRTYTGTTAAGINYKDSSVFGSLLGTQPTTLTNSNNIVTSQLLTNISTTNVATTNVTISNSGVVLVTNRTITTNTVTQSNLETVIITNTVLNPVLIATGVDGSFQASVTGKQGVFTFQGPGQLTSPGPIVDGQQTNSITAFNVNGIRTSFSSQSSFQQVGGGAAPTAP